MTMQKLPNDIQSLFCASTQICNYKRAIEELVYNALDADSTSIAIRVNIAENTIQVIDNGCGIIKSDFRLLGQRYATSRYVDLATLKSAPNKYGFRGQALSSIIKVSYSVKITSLCYDSNNTWVKSFEKGIENNILETIRRPSKGTTVEIKGFLYNLKIQSKSIDSLNELSNLKIFLEQLSLVHNNVSLSLRDDSKNDIIFQLHKNRDIYQTLSSMFEINKNDLQELKVEKNEYKVTAYIAKRDKEIHSKHLIYLNGKLLQKSKIHKLINDILTKTLKLNIIVTTNVQSKRSKNQKEENLNNTKIPTYFIFITCPYYDYDISYLSKQTTVEFKTWEQVAKLMEKLIQFYASDGNFKEVKHIKNRIENQSKEDETRKQVSKIMEKILGNNPTKISISQMQNGIKGKVIKRKPRRKLQKITLSKSIPMKVAIVEKDNEKQHTDKLPDQSACSVIKPYASKEDAKKNKEAIRIMNKRDKTLLKKVHDKKNYKILKNNKFTTIAKKNEPHKEKRKEINMPRVSKKLDYQTRISEDDNNGNELKQKLSKIKQRNDSKIKSSHKFDPLLNNFIDDPTGSIKKRCNVLAKKVDDLMNFKTKGKRKIVINETVKYSNVIRNNKKYSVRKKFDAIVIHDYIPLPPKVSLSSLDNYVCNRAKLKPCKTSYDLIRTVLKTQETSKNLSYVENINHTAEKTQVNVNPNYTPVDIPVESYELRPKYAKEPSPSFPYLPVLTFESHNYNMKHVNQISHKFNFNHGDNPEPKIKQFISTRSKENFLIPRIYESSFSKKFTCKSSKPNQKKTSYSKRLSNLNNLRAFSYSIEFSNSKLNDKLIKEHVETQDTNISYPEIDFTRNTITRKGNNHTKEQNDDIGFSSRFNCTYTVTVCESQRDFPENKNLIFKEATIDSKESHCENGDVLYNSNIDNANENTNIIFISRSQNQDCSIEGLISNHIDPLNICETVHSDDWFENQQINTKKRNDSLFNDEFYIDSLLCDRNAYTQRLSSNVLEPQITHAEIVNTDKNDNKQCILQSQVIKHNFRHNEFSFKNRPRFIPKGMSQIYENCKTKNVCDYNLAADYYEENVYFKFAQDVHLNAEIYEARVQNVKELATKAIEKVSDRLNEDNASLVFDGECLKQTKVLGQVDLKFIAANIAGKSHEAFGSSQYLVLFDQHAVDERIRLEQNLSSYFDGERWKSIALDDMAIKLSRDEILYLHNYKDKFTQLGLHWDVINSEEVLVNAIPEAILGKNPRQVDVVLKAVKNLITEEIYYIKAQSGCFALHPKSIMDLVFSEACRNAIKFGDKLSMNDCDNLLLSLSECKTPFQCAHGRPVMAVLMDIKAVNKEYKIDFSHVRKWLNCKKI